MTGSNQHRIDHFPAPQRDHVADLHDVVVLPRAAEGTASSAPPVVIGNVVPFARPRREPEDAAAAAVAADMPLPAAPSASRGRLKFVGFVAASLLAHTALYFVFNREPEPMASIGLEAISVEIVLGANMPAGPASSQGQSEAQSAPANDPEPKPADTETAKPDAAKDATPVEEARVVPPEPEEKPAETAAAPAETPPERVEPQPQSLAALPEPAPAPREPERAVAPPPEPAKPEIAPPPPRPEAKPKPVQKREVKPKAERDTKPKQEQPGPRARTASIDPAATGPRANAAGGVGAGRSQNDSNYRGLVAAHLARHKQYPAEARSRGDQGTGTVSFALDGGGRVTRVALGRGTGFATLDQELQAMVRRASPFPAPPDGRAMSFTVPVTFRFQ